MTETIFAGKQVKEFPDMHASMRFGFLHAKFTWLAENFFMRYGPGDTGDGYRQYKKPGYLFGDC